MHGSAIYGSHTRLVVHAFTVALRFRFIAGCVTAVAAHLDTRTRARGSLRFGSGCAPVTGLYAVVYRILQHLLPGLLPHAGSPRSWIAPLLRLHCGSRSAVTVVHFLLRHGWITLFTKFAYHSCGCLRTVTALHAAAALHVRTPQLLTFAWFAFVVTTRLTYHRLLRRMRFHTTVGYCGYALRSAFSAAHVAGSLRVYRPHTCVGSGSLPCAVLVPFVACSRFTGYHAFLLRCYHYCLCSLCRLRLVLVTCVTPRRLRGCHGSFACHG